MGDLSHSLYEELVGKATEFLKNKNYFPEYWLTQRNRGYDKNGVDLIIILWSGLAVFVQIKVVGGERIFSSCNRANHGKLIKHFKNHPNIRIFIMVPKKLVKHNPPNLCELIAEELRRAINKAIKETREI